MSRNTKSSARTALSILLAFFLCLLVFVTTCVGILQTTVLNENYMRAKLSQSEFYEQMADEIEQKFSSFGAASGFDEQFFDGTVDPVRVQQDIGNAVTQLYNNRSKQVDTSDFKQQLHQLFLTDIQERGIEVTPELEEAVQALTDACIQSYQDAVSVPYITEISHYVQKGYELARLILIVLIVVIVVIAAVLFFMHSWKHRALRYYIYALSGSALMMIMLPVIVFLSGKVQRIGLASASLYHFAVSYINGFLWRFGAVALFLALVVVALGIVYQKLKKAVE